MALRVLDNVDNMGCCPHCGSKEYFTSVKIRGRLKTVISFETHEEVRDEEVIDPMEPAKFAYCNGCNECIGKIEY